MSNDPEDRPVNSGSEVSKQWMFSFRFLLHIQRLEGGLAARLKESHLHSNLGIITVLHTGTPLTGLQGLRGEEYEVGFSEDSVNQNNERNQDKEEKEGEWEIQNFPRQEKIIPRKFFPNNLEIKRICKYIS